MPKRTMATSLIALMLLAFVAIEAGTPASAAIAMPALTTTKATAAPAPTTPPVPPTTSCDAGQVIEGQTWDCALDDEFNGTALDRNNWVVNNGFVTGNPHGGTYACTVDDPRYINVNGGALHLTMQKVTTPVACNGYAASKTEAPTVSSWHLFSQQYGRVEMRTRATKTTAKGLQESFWMWADDRYSKVNSTNTGEIDIAEQFSQYPALAIPYLHYTNNGLKPAAKDATNTTCQAARGEWNTYTLTWTPTTIAININGVRCLTNTSDNPVFDRRNILLLSQAIGLGSNAPTAATPAVATTDVDYVRVWSAVS